MQNENSEKRVDRRTFLTYLNFALGGFISVALGIPLVGSLVLPTLKQREAIWSPAGPIGDYPLGQPKAATVTVTIRDGWDRAPGGQRYLGGTQQPGRFHSTQRPLRSPRLRL